MLTYLLGEEPNMFVCSSSIDEKKSTSAWLGSFFEVEGSDFGVDELGLGFGEVALPEDEAATYPIQHLMSSGAMSTLRETHVCFHSCSLALILPSHLCLLELSEFYTLFYFARNSDLSNILQEQ